jgi:hypothetical protein
MWNAAGVRVPLEATLAALLCLAAAPALAQPDLGTLIGALQHLEG